MKKPCITAVNIAVILAMISFIVSATAGEVDRKNIKVSASSWEQKAKGGWGDMIPERALDGDFKTAWMAEGDGEWIQFDLGRIVPLKAVKLAFPSRSNQVYTFDILVSETGADNSWTTVGNKLKSSGKTAEYELFEFKPVKARFVRVVGFGSTSKQFAKWNNISEAAFVTE